MHTGTGYHAIRRWQKNEVARFGTGDVLVLFGELFQRGYANGLVEEAQRRGMKIVYATVGRRDKDGGLRALNAEELALQPQPLINVPLEAGFDLEPDDSGVAPVDRCKDVKLSDWEQAQLPEASLLQSRQRGRDRFQNSIRQFLRELRPHLPKGKNILFAHLMAGGVPRTKIIMPLMNRSVKGSGERFLSSEIFWKSSLGRFCALNFEEVTAHTFEILLSETTELRKEKESEGAFCSYSAYGYHGTEVLIGNQMTWQTYSPYLQGWAKKSLEEGSRRWNSKGVRSCVYNCPEILTNSSSIFQGVEIPLYPLLIAMKKFNAGATKTQELWKNCQALLKPGIVLEDLLKICQDTLSSPVIRAHCDFENWPQHNSQAQLETLLDASHRLTSSHENEKILMTNLLSEVVFESCGRVMLEDAAKPQSPVTWLNHDVIAQTALET